MTWYVLDQKQVLFMIIWIQKIDFQPSPASVRAIISPGILVVTIGYPDPGIS